MLQNKAELALLTPQIFGRTEDYHSHVKFSAGVIMNTFVISSKELQRTPMILPNKFMGKRPDMLPPALLSHNPVGTVGTIYMKLGWQLL
jgi:hypothetical protein